MGNKMKSIIAAVLAIGAICLAAWIWHARQESTVRALGGMAMDGAGDNETHAHKLDRLRAGADQAVRMACTNATIGLRSIISTDTETHDDNFMKWTASATVEYVNKVGGVERVNYEFRPYVVGGDFSWIRK